MADELWFDPESGAATKKKARDRWQVIRDGESVSLLADNGDGQHVLIGSAKWSGKGLAKRYAVDKPIEPSTWGRLEHVLRNHLDGDSADPPEPATEAASGNALRIVVDLAEGKLVDHGRAANIRAMNAFARTVILDGDRARVEDSTGTMVGTARWDGINLTAREGDVHDYQWNAIENVVISVMTGQPEAPSMPEPEPVASNAPPHLIVVDLSTGKVCRHGGLASTERARTAFEWNVIADGSRTTATIEDSAGGRIATARWNGDSLTKRKAEGEINDHQWGLVENAWIEVLTWGTPAERRRSRDPDGRVSLRQASSEVVQSRDPRSGWWALGAFLLALGGFIVAWMAHTTGDTISLITIIVLGVLALGLGIYNLYGVTTRCPRCKAWYRRETTSVENLGSHTATRTESKPVYDSSGKQTGTTSHTYTVRITNYRYHYRCKECSNTWTGSGSSESRV